MDLWRAADPADPSVVSPPADHGVVTLNNCASPHNQPWPLRASTLSNTITVAAVQVASVSFGFLRWQTKEGLSKIARRTDFRLSWVSGTTAWTARTFEVELTTAGWVSPSPPILHHTHARVNQSSDGLSAPDCDSDLRGLTVTDTCSSVESESSNLQAIFLPVFTELALLLVSFCKPEQHSLRHMLAENKELTTRHMAVLILHNHLLDVLHHLNTAPSHAHIRRDAIYTTGTAVAGVIKSQQSSS